MDPRLRTPGLDRTFRQKRVKQRLNEFFLEKNSNGVKAKVLRNIINVNEPRKLTLRERKTPFNRTGLAVSSARPPLQRLYSGVRCCCKT